MCIYFYANLRMICVFSLSHERSRWAWMSGAPGLLVHVMLVSFVENYSLPSNWNTTWTHVLIRSLHGFSKCLSSSPRESCADSLTCHCKPWGFAEGTLTGEQVCLVSFFSLLSQPLTNLSEHIDLHCGQRRVISSKILVYHLGCCSLSGCSGL